MAEKYLFFNSTQTDRRRNQASDMADYWRSFLFTGLIHRNFKPNLQVFANGNNREITVEPGKALIAGCLYIRNNVDNQPYRIDDPDSLLDRIDRVVLRFDNRIDNRYIKAFIKKGEPSINPDPPTLERVFLIDGDDEPLIYELSLAQIRIVAGKSYIEQADILDERLDQSVCGLAHSLVAVPTDVFVEQWNKFVEEYTRWFTDLQGSSFATVNDVRNSENQIKREVANLNLQLEASRRVKDGVTFGTNFYTSFGMEIDMARTSTYDAIEAGTQTIHVRDVRDFKPNKEVTVYDDVNLERIKIIQVDVTPEGDMITFERPLTNSYKEGANVARTMAVQRPYYEAMEFGVWGTYENKVYNEMELTTEGTQLNGVTEHTLVRAGDSWYKINYSGTYWYLGRLRDGTTTWEFVRKNGTEYFDQGTPKYYKLLSDGKYLILVGNIGINQLRVQTILDGDWVDDKTFDVDAGIQNLMANFYERERLIYIVTGLTGSQSVLSRRAHAIKIDQNGLVSKHGNSVPIPALETNKQSIMDRTKNLSFVIDNNYVYFALTSGLPGSTTVEYNAEIIRVDDKFTAADTFHVDTIYVPSGGLMVDLQKINGKFSYMLAESWGASSSNRGKVFESTDLNTWTQPVTFTVPTRMTLFYRVRNGDAYYFSYGSSARIYELKHNQSTFNIIDTKSSSISGIAYIDPDSEVDIPFVLVGGQGNIINGRGILGYGNELLVNDVRFTVKPSKEAVFWVNRDEEIRIDFAKFNGLEMDKVSTKDEDQFTKVLLEEHSEIMFSFSRNNVETNPVIKRILGGVE